jgi:16S rRNA processing protein RimM
MVSANENTNAKRGPSLCVGAVAGAHGIRGSVRLKSFMEEPEDIFAYRPVTDEAGRVFVLKRQGMNKDCFVVSIEGVKDRNAAEALRGTKLYVSRDLLPKLEANQYFEADLIGLEVRCDDPRGAGKLTAVHDYGAGSFLEIKPENAASFMLPFKKAFVPEVNPDQGFVKIVLPEGWLDKPEKEDEEE